MQELCSKLVNFESVFVIFMSLVAIKLFVSFFSIWNVPRILDVVGVYISFQFKSGRQVSLQLFLISI